jgi:putative ATP-dependent endonuclease of OLD family
MRINKITVQNFRSIKEAEITPDSFNFFVGQNNHGKTNFFDALDYFYNGIARGQSLNDLRFNHDSALDVVVAVEFADVQNGVETMKNEKNKETVRKMLGDNQTITLSRKNDEKWQIIVGGETLEKNPTGFENATKDFLPRLEYVSTKKIF